MPWSSPFPPPTMLAVVIGRAVSLTAAECLFRTFLGLLAKQITEDVAKVWTIFVFHAQAYIYVCIQLIP